MKRSALVVPIAPSMLVSRSVSLPRLAVSVVPLRSTTTRVAAEGEGGEIHPGATVQPVVARPAVEHVAAVAGVQGVGAAQAPQQVVAA